MLNKLQTFLYEEIPLTEKMGLTLVNFSDDELLVNAPLDLNINDKSTVFGGSSSALMIIAAWSLIKLNCEKHNIDADIVIHKNETTWQKAMSVDLILKARFHQPYPFEEIKTTIESGKHKRIECSITLEDHEAKIYSTMLAKYVIIPKIKNET